MAKTITQKKSRFTLWFTPWRLFMTIFLAVILCTAYAYMRHMDVPMAVVWVELILALLCAAYAHFFKR